MKFYSKFVFIITFYFFFSFVVKCNNNILVMLISCGKCTATIDSDQGSCLGPDFFYKVHLVYRKFAINACDFYISNYFCLFLLSALSFSIASDFGLPIHVFTPFFLQ